MTDQVCIDMSIYEDRVYMGRDKGAASYLYFDLLCKEQAGPLPIVIAFPDDTKAIISSFFLGMFGDCIRRIGNKTAFYQHYKFTGSTLMLADIDEYVDIALSAS